MVKLTTTLGEILIELYPEQAPQTCENFLQYVKDGFYDGTIFHRVISNFMIQGGGFEPGMIQKPAREPITNEAKNGLSNAVGTLAMARTSAPHSASAQFFINVSNNAFLDYPGQDGWGYCVFGKVVDGLAVVEQIKAVATGSHGPFGDVPLEDVLIQRAEVVES